MHIKGRDGIPDSQLECIQQSTNDSNDYSSILDLQCNNLLHQSSHDLRFLSSNLQHLLMRDDLGLRKLNLLPSQLKKQQANQHQAWEGGNAKAEG